MYALSPETFIPMLPTTLSPVLYLVATQQARSIAVGGIAY